MEKLNCSGIAIMPTPKQGVAQRKNRTDTAYSVFGSAKWGDAFRETVELREAKIDGWMTLHTEKRTDDWGWRVKYIQRSKDKDHPFWIEAESEELNVLVADELDENDTLEYVPVFPESITMKKLEVVTGKPRKTLEGHLMKLMKTKRVECNDKGKAYQYYRPAEETF
jgi:hypothetical protein